jgi:hypothetical protein
MWLVYRIGGARAAYLGAVKAPDRESALDLALDEFELAPPDRKRLIALRASDHA